MPFPTATDLAFYRARNQPKWADRIGKNYTRPSLNAPNIDHVINAHAGVRLGDTNAHNLMVLVRGWRDRGEDVLARLLDLANNHLCATRNRKRAALAKKWAARLA